MKKKKVHHDVQTVAEKKFWQTFSAKNVIKWYEYQMAPADGAEEDDEAQSGAFVAEPRENLEDEVSRIMNAFQNSKQDSVDSLLREMGGSSEPAAQPAPESVAAAPAADAGTEELNYDGVDPEMVARIMDSFKTAKQDSVDSLFAAAEAETAPAPEPAMAEAEAVTEPATEPETTGSTEKAGESEEDILASIASRSQQNQIDALFANQ